MEDQNQANVAVEKKSIGEASQGGDAKGVKEVQGDESRDEDNSQTDATTASSSEPWAVAARVTESYNALLSALESVIDVRGARETSGAKYELAENVARTLERFDDACASLKYTALRAKSVYGVANVPKARKADEDVRTARKQRRELPRRAALGLGEEKNK